jgi:hypothetical protein
MVQIVYHFFSAIEFFAYRFFENTLSFFRDNKYAILFIALVFLSTLFGTDQQRLMAPAFLIVYLLIGKIINDVQNSLFLFILIACSFLSAFHHQIGRYPLPSRDLMVFISLGLLLIVTVVAFVFRIRILNRITPNHSD